MKISQAGINAIKFYEALRLTAYQDGGGVWTIGYGSTYDVKPGDVITEDEAEDRLTHDLAEAEEAISIYVDVDLEQHQYDALVSLVFNIGTDAFHPSTLLRLLNHHDYEGAAKQFPRWCHDNGKVVQGLVNRREKERRMFMGEGA